MDRVVESKQAAVEPRPPTPTPTPLPAYLNDDYIQSALAHAFNSKALSVESCLIEAISMRGDNFCSVIYRVTVAYRKSPGAPLEQGSFVLKDLLPIMAELGSNELYMYTKVLPAMAQILEQAEPPINKVKLSPNCLFTERADGKEIYLLEDLNALGFRSMDRYTGLCYEKALVCLRQMAQFHAVSMRLLEQQPQLLEALSPSSYAAGVENTVGQVYILDSTTFTADLVEKWPNMSHIADKMRAQLPKTYSKRISEVVDPQRAAFKGIVHGDLWVNNMLLSEKGEPAILVDFQNSFVGSPAIDVTFLLYTSLQLDVLQQQRDKLIEHYHKSLVETLQACHYAQKIPTLEDMHGEMRRCLFYGYYGVVCELAVCCASKAATEDFTLLTFIDPEAIHKKRQQIYGNERVRATLQATLCEFEAQGILDVL